MENLLLFILGCSGITLILSISKLFEPFRNWLKDDTHFIKMWLHKLISCPMCLGMYVGPIMFLMNKHFYMAYELLASGGMISLVAWFIYMNVSKVR